MAHPMPSPKEEMIPKVSVLITFNNVLRAQNNKQRLSFFDHQRLESD